ncbi:FKBP-type peptidyl-prolyl cis-trans isomerase [Salinibacterium sp. SYSU T00001]|uniref:FKBP-type peptidyl-prolyl cis-trans isomerase n=1 Tax=Homoserinimonas sedimenticola TaxID=2986805 RepID=UPI0022364227|nr:FKBP-type peptidyl-prolyl cis-trans isomerase [Salinibacterium sedimenticola]MCW4384474.1 FKBP-type peptidyl-prolyl cis-trans isomerase [Salinibacterium sedimenticola]
MRTLPALLTVAVVLPALAACSAQPDACELPSGDASSVVTAEGAFGSAPEIDMPTPVITQESQASVLVEGEGDLLAPGQPALVQLSLLNGGTGELLQDTYQDAPILQVAGTETLPPVGAALECAREGSRIVAVGSPQATHGGEAIPELGVAADDSFVFVIDVLQTFLPKADGVTRAGNNGDPAVALAPNGRPGITVPNTEAPEDAVISVLKEGDGAELEEGDQAVLHYTGITWAEEEVFDSSWEAGAPRIFDLSEGSLIEGFYDGIVGQKVGSQVLLVIPPELGYGDQASASIPAGSTLIFVVDILGIVE